MHKSAVTMYTNLHFNATEKENAVLGQDEWAKAAQKSKMAKRSERLARFEEKAYDGYSTSINRNEMGLFRIVARAGWCWSPNRI